MSFVAKELSGIRRTRKWLAMLISAEIPRPMFLCVVGCAIRSLKGVTIGGCFNKRFLFSDKLFDLRVGDIDRMS